MSGIWKRKKRSDIQTPTNRKGRKQLRLNLTPPRQISTLPKAQREAEETRGQAEADAARIYANAHHQAPDFYKFLRGIEALEKIINQNTTLVIDANTPPFDLLKSPLPDGEGRPAADRP